MTEKIAGLRPGPLDMHAHILPKSLLERLQQRKRAGFELEIGPDGARRLTLGGNRMRMPVLPGMDSMEIRLRTMDEQGVSAQVLSPWIALVPNHLGEADAFWLAEALNAGIAEVTQTDPDRF